ncbi:glycosyltransferase family 4 protein [Pseudescherichia sp.]|uniref:glycosyltransferase family 4 protein n=1 Tax=Pseudescherichia sp. TaxID=2055881 RepID=UPI0028A1EEB1|nr:glycosyltransferase family 4 protein [Pseudescherichia sp.]
MNFKKTKVLHLQLLPLLSGVQRVTLNELRELRYDFDYKVVCSTPGPLTEALSELNIQTFYVGELCRDISLKKDIVAIYKLYNYIKNEQFDVVHTHSSKTGVLGRIAAKLAGVSNIIHTVHGFSFPAASNKRKYYLYFFLEWVAKFFTDKLIVLNKDDEDTSLHKLKYKRKQVHLIANGVDTSKFYPAEKKSINKSLKLIMVGRLSQQKDPETLLDAVQKLLVKNIDVTITFVGDGELKDILQKKIEDGNERIIFNGWSNDPSKILSENDLFILPSLWEGMPLAILEALSCGLPCIVTNIPGNNSLISSGYNGQLFEPKNSQQLADIIESYYQHRHLLKEQSINAREFIIKNYTLSKRNDLVKKLYK